MFLHRISKLTNYAKNQNLISKILTLFCTKELRTFYFLVEEDNKVMCELNVKVRGYGFCSSYKNSYEFIEKGENKYYIKMKNST
jgi:hypothetical protein